MATTLTKKNEDFLKNCMTMADKMIKLSTQRVWIDYDREADVLYMSFRKPQKATRTIEVDEDILVRKDKQEIVGITIMNASTRRYG